MLSPAQRSDRLTERATRVLVEVIPRVVGLVFLAAGLIKAKHPGNLYTVLRFDALASRWTPAVGWTVICIELLLGALLLILARKKWVLGASLGLLVLYSGQLIFLLVSHGAPSCGCLEVVEAFHRARQYNAMSLVRNICLLVAQVWVWLQLPVMWGAESAAPGGSAEGWG